jgi:long-chain fatty acid transport protein
VKLALALVILLLSCGFVVAQTNERIYEELDFRFVTPGARAISMGKAFVGLADDATAAYSNPAGLSNLLEQEISVEFTRTEIKHHRLIPSEDAQTQVFGETVYTPSFLSYAIPYHDFTFSFFRNVVQHYREKFQFDPRFIPSINALEDGAFGNVDIEAENYAAGISYAWNGFLSVGASAGFTSIDVASQGRSGSPLNPRNGTDTIDNGYAWTGIFGVLVKPVKRLSIGAVYNAGSKFDLVTTLFGNFRMNGRDVVLTGTERPIQYIIPDRFTVGTSAQIGKDITVVADVGHIFYSQLVGDKFLIVDFQDPSANITPQNFFIHDVTELHVGGEYRIYKQSAIYAIRAGFFTDPDHQLRFRTLPNTDPLAGRILSFRFNTIADHTDIGWTIGAGFALGNRFQMDLGGSFSRDSDEFVLSSVFKL